VNRIYRIPGIRNRGNRLHIAARKKLALLDCAINGRVQIQTRNHLAGNPALLRQLMQCVLHIDMQGAGKFVGEIPAWRTIDE
jgi:hypothetical protein